MSLMILKTDLNVLLRTLLYAETMHGFWNFPTTRSSRTCPSETVNDEGYSVTCQALAINTSRPRQNGLFADDTFKHIFLNENIRISIKISLKFVPKVPINNIPALVQIMAWCRPGDKPLSGPMMVRLPTHICVTRPQWVKHDDTWYKWCPCLVLVGQC